MPTISANGVDLYYERSGKGKRLLFFIGSGESLESFAPLIKPFTEHFDVVANDPRGIGKSSSPTEPYSMADYAADAAALIDELGWESCRVIGISFGGMVAQEFAVTMPSRVERLALCCTSAGGAGGASYPLQDLAALPPAERAKTQLLLLDSRFHTSHLVTHPADLVLAGRLASRHMMDKDKSDKEKRGEAAQLQARAAHDVSARLSQITAPTLVAVGKYDGIAPKPNGEYIAAHIPNAEHREYEGGHLFIAQDAKAQPEIIEFLNG